MRAAEAGLGIAQIPSFMLGDALEAGRLVEVLPDRPPEILGIYAVHPAGALPAAEAAGVHRLHGRAFQGHGAGRLAAAGIAG